MTPHTPPLLSRRARSKRQFSAHAISLGAMLASAFLAFSCSDNETSGQPEIPSGTVSEAGPFLYDGYWGAPIGDYRITDLRTKMVASGSDSIDIYGEMENYETRNLTVFHKTGLTDQPVIFFIHGGGWTDNYMEWFDFVAESFTAGKGWVTVVANYRLTSDQVFPTAICSTRTSPAPDPSLKAAWYPDNIEDCADGLQWVIDEISTYGGDPEKIFVFGHSAGGHLASLLTTHPDYVDLRGSIRGLISMSGAYLLTEINLPTFAPAMEQTFGTYSDSEILIEASPSTYVVDGIQLPPVLILYAEDELLSLVSQAIAFDNRLELMGQDVESVYLQGYGHVSELEAIEFPEEDPTAEIIRFVESQLPQ